MRGKTKHNIQKIQRMSKEKDIYKTHYIYNGSRNLDYRKFSNTEERNQQKIKHALKIQKYFLFSKGGSRKKNVIRKRKNTL